jgi:tungstate transport system ATP-binding protein
VALYRLQGIQRHHGKRTVLDIDALSISGQRIYTLIGPNGAGKTSLLKILAFLDLPSSGILECMNRVVPRSEKHLHHFRQDVVLLDQSPIMFTGSVYQNIEFGLKVRKISPALRKKRIEEVLEMVGMGGFASYQAQQLSGGETRRVALARALVLQPTVLLCDEPTANVDSENQEIILGIIKQANRQQKTSIIFSTHYLSEGRRLADHTLLLQHGRLSDMVSENIFRITIANQGEGHFLCQLSGQLYLRLPESLLPEKEHRTKIHIDPARIICNPRQEDCAEGNVLTGHVTELRQLGGRVALLVDVGVKLGVHIPEQQYRLERPAIGDKLKLSIPHRSIQFSQSDLF